MENFVQKQAINSHIITITGIIKKNIFMNLNTNNQFFFAIIHFFFGSYGVNVFFFFFLYCQNLLLLYN